MIGESAASDASGLFQVGSPALDTPVGNAASIGPVGEKPSQRLNGSGSNATASRFLGIASIGISSRRPVTVVESLTSYAADGHGSKQPCPPSGLHRSGMSLPPLHAVIESVTTRTTRRGSLTPRTVSSA